MAISTDRGTTTVMRHPYQCHRSQRVCCLSLLFSSPTLSSVSPRSCAPHLRRPRPGCRRQSFPASSLPSFEQACFVSTNEKQQRLSISEHNISKSDEKKSRKRKPSLIHSRNTRGPRVAAWHTAACI